MYLTLFINKYKFFLVFVMLLLVLPLEAQRKRIQSNVKDKNGNRIEGVTIKDKKSGDQEGSTDVDGGALLTLKVGQALLFSHQSYTEKEGRRLKTAE